MICFHSSSVRNVKADEATVRPANSATGATEGSSLGGCVGCLVVCFFWYSPVLCVLSTIPDAPFLILALFWAMYCMLTFTKRASGILESFPLLTGILLR